MNELQMLEDVANEMNEEILKLHRQLDIAKKETCIWEYYEENENGFYRTSCGQELFHLEFIGGSQYCNFCGKHLEIV